MSNKKNSDTAKTTDAIIVKDNILKKIGRLLAKIGNFIAKVAKGTWRGLVFAVLFIWNAIKAILSWLAMPFIWVYQVAKGLFSRPAQQPQPQPQPAAA